MLPGRKILKKQPIKYRENNFEVFNLAVEGMNNFHLRVDI